MKKNYTFIDLFAGCGGLSEGFLASGKFHGLAHVEWEIPIQLKTHLVSVVFNIVGHGERSPNTKIVF